jgi:hypothetical protein
MWDLKKKHTPQALQYVIIIYVCSVCVMLAIFNFLTCLDVTASMSHPV